MDERRLETIRQVAEPILAEADTELVELTCRRAGAQAVVRLLVDQVGGVTIQHCARLNRLIGQALDESGCLGQESYTLEVSSPGLDRPLVSKRDFERAVGERLELFLAETLNGSQQLVGMLLAVQPEAIVVTTKAGNVTVPLGIILRARKALQW